MSLGLSASVPWFFCLFPLICLPLSLVFMSFLLSLSLSRCWVVHMECSLLSLELTVPLSVSLCLFLSVSVRFCQPLFISVSLCFCQPLFVSVSLLLSASLFLSACVALWCSVYITAVSLPVWLSLGWCSCSIVLSLEFVPWFVCLSHLICLPLSLVCLSFLLSLS